MRSKECREAINMERGFFLSCATSSQAPCLLDTFADGFVQLVLLELRNYGNQSLPADTHTLMGFAVIDLFYLLTVGGLNWSALCVDGLDYGALHPDHPPALGIVAHGPC